MSQKSRTLAERFKRMSSKRNKSMTFSTTDLSIPLDAEFDEAKSTSPSKMNDEHKSSGTLRRFSSFCKLHIFDDHSTLSIPSKLKSNGEFIFNNPPNIETIADLHSLNDDEKLLVFKMFNLDYLTPTEAVQHLIDATKDEKKHKIILSYFALYTLAGIDMYECLKLMSIKLDLSIETNYLEQLIRFMAHQYYIQNKSDFRFEKDVKDIMFELLLFNTKIQLLGLDNAPSKDEFIMFISDKLETFIYNDILEISYERISKAQIYVKNGPYYKNPSQPSSIYYLNPTLGENRLGELYYMNYHQIKYKQHPNWESILEFSKEKNRNSIYNVYLVAIYKFYILLIDLAKCSSSNSGDEKHLYSMYKKKQLPTVDGLSIMNFLPDHVTFVPLVSCRILNQTVMNNSFKVFAISNSMKVDEFKFVIKISDKSQSQNFETLTNMIRFLSAIVTNSLTKSELSEFSSVITKAVRLQKGGSGCKNQINEAQEALSFVDESICTLAMKSTFELNYRADALSEKVECLLSLYEKITGIQDSVGDSKNTFKRSLNTSDFIQHASKVLMLHIQLLSTDINTLRKLKYPKPLR